MNEQSSNYWSRRVSRRTALRGTGIALAGLTAAALIGCGDDDDDDAATGTPSGATPSGTSPATQTPVSQTPRGGSLTFGYHGDPGFLSPRQSRSGFDNAFLLASGDNYVYANSDGSVDPTRSLWESWEYTDDTTLVVNLRENVNFHDGTPLDSAAVKGHLEFIADEEKAPSFGYASLISTIASIDTPDTYTVRFNLSQPDAGFLPGLMVAPGIPFSLTQIEKLGDDEILNPAMTGPYKVAGYVSGSDWTYVKNENFWGPAEGEPFLDELKYRAITESETRAAALESGEVDAIWFTAANETTKRLSEDDSLQSRSFESGPTLLTINQNKPPLDDLRLRQAIAHALDKERFLQALFQGQGGIAKNMLPSNTFGYVDYEPYPYNPEKGKQLVAETGIETPIEISYAFGGSPPSAAAQLTAALTKEMLDEVGFDVQLENVPGSGAIFDALFRDKTHHIGAFSTGVRPDPVAEYALYSTSEAFYNAGGDTTDPAQAELDALVAQARATLADEERGLLVQDIWRKQADNVFSQIPIVARVRWAFAQRHVGGVDNPEFLNTLAGASFRARLLSRTDV